MNLDRDTWEAVKNAKEVKEEPDYTTLDKAVRVSNKVLGYVVECMTGNKVRYPGDIAFGVRSISEFYKKLRGSEEKSERLSYPVD